jgi:hypothetical protein
MEVVVERCAGIDVHKDMVAVCVRVPGPDGERVADLAEFRTFTEDLLALRDWLVAHGVTRVGMKATGVYWKPVFWVLEDDLECWLLNARHMRNVPGRKTDMADAEWICRLMEHGLVRASFVPPQGDPGAAGFDQVPKDPDRGAHQRGPAPGQDPPRRRGEALERRLGRVGPLRARHA